jgi:predicted nucleotidyltransferase
MVRQIHSIKQIQDRLTPVFERNGISKAILFGSYGRNAADEGSDIDILVSSSLKGLRFVGFINEVQEAVDKEVDLFDVSHIDEGGRLDTEIKSTGIVIYEK